MISLNSPDIVVFSLWKRFIMVHFYNCCARVSACFDRREYWMNAICLEKLWNTKKKKKTVLSEVCTINKERLIVLITSYEMYKKYKRLVYRPSDLSARFCKVNLSNTKKSGLVFNFGLPFRQRRACKWLAIVSYNWPLKLYFGAVQLTL